MYGGQLRLMAGLLFWSFGYATKVLFVKRCLMVYILTPIFLSEKHVARDLGLNFMPFANQNNLNSRSNHRAVDWSQLVASKLATHSTDSPTVVFAVDYISMDGNDRWPLYASERRLDVPTHFCGQGWIQ
ncbi:hypothetical protein K439DRAFT_44695 [Ramaria rubella]|nr:hypothetical protein K439DRAFT_44695 [Ramaria rubella]